MKNNGKTFQASYKLLFGALLSVGFLSQVSATETQTVTASVTVNNGFDFGKEEDLNFGWIVARADTSGTDVSTLTLDPDGTVSVSNGSASSIIYLQDAQPALFAITNAAPNTNLNITLPDVASTPITLTGGSSGMTFEITQLLLENSDTGGVGTTTGTVTTLVTNGTGELNLALGGVLATTNTGGLGATQDPYEDVDYTSAAFTVSVDY